MRRVISRSYRNGESGDHSFGFATGRFAVLFAADFASATTLPPSRIFISATAFGSAESTLMSKLEESRSGVILTPDMCVGDTGSSHTVCHIPETAV